MAMLLAASAASATNVVSWIGASGGLWEDPTNWSTSQVPGVDSTARFELDEPTLVIATDDVQVRRFVVARGELSLAGAVVAIGAEAGDGGGDGGEGGDVPLPPPGLRVGDAEGSEATLRLTKGRLVGFGDGSWLVREAGTLRLLADESVLPELAAPVLRVDGRLIVDESATIETGDLQLAATARVRLTVPALGGELDAVQAPIEAIQATIAGSLALTLPADGSLPSLGQTSLLVNSPAGVDVTGEFELVQSPLFAGDRFFNVVNVALDDGDGTYLATAAIVEALEDVIELDEPEVFGLAGQPTAAAAGDITRDGFVDLAVGIAGELPGTPGNLLVLRNGGTDENGVWLGYTGIDSYPVGPEPLAVGIADFDGQNGPDVVLASFTTDRLELLLNDGTGVLLAPTQIPVGDGPIALDVGDIDGDGRPDIAVAERNANQIRLLVNEAGAQTGVGFGVGGLFGTGAAPGGISFGDLDSDKDLDLIASVNKDGSTVTVVPFGTGGAASGVVAIAVGPGPNDLAIIDLDGDGLAEIVTANDGQKVMVGGQVVDVRDSITVLAGLGDGSFERLPDPDYGFGVRSLSVLDLENDADFDLVLVSTEDAGPRRVFTVRNDDELSDDDQVALGDPIQENSAANPFLAVKGEGPAPTLDVDNDGDSDPTIVNGDPLLPDSALGDGGQSVWVYLNDLVVPVCPGDVDGDGTVNMSDLESLLTFYGDEVEPGTHGDLTGDGLIDIADLNALLDNWMETCFE